MKINQTMIQDGAMIEVRICHHSLPYIMWICNDVRIIIFNDLSKLIYVGMKYALFFTLQGNKISY